MSKSDSSNSIGGTAFQVPRYRPNWVAAILCALSGTYITAALMDYSPSQTTFHSTSPTGRNWVGWVGADSVWIL